MITLFTNDRQCLIRLKGQLGKAPSALLNLNQFMIQMIRRLDEN
jgi:hypothetical protein